MQNLVNENLSKLSAISVALGSNPRLIQGAGGNTSFKTEENLWIKASGMWLSYLLGFLLPIFGRSGSGMVKTSKNNY